jgi:hypothetical protein
MELPFAVVFKAIDSLSGTVDNIGKRFNTLTERVKGTGEALINAGERLALASGLASEGISQLRELGASITEPAIDMEHAMATMAATTRLAGEQLTKLKEAAIAFSDTHPGTTAEEWIAGFTRFQGVYHDTAKAMQAEDIAAELGRLGIATDAVTNLMQVSWSNQRTDAKTTGDEIAKAVEVYAIAPDKVGQFSMAVAKLGASAALSNSPLSETIALTGEASRLMGGGRGTMMLNAMIPQLIKASEQGKVALDFTHGLFSALKQLKDQIGGNVILPENFYHLSAKKQDEMLQQLSGDEIQRAAALGISNPVAMVNLLAHYDEMVKSQGQVADSSGTLQKKYTTATDNMKDATTKLHQAWSNFGDALTTPALPTETYLTDELTKAITRLTGATEHHSIVAGLATGSIQLLGSGLYRAMQAMNALGATMILGGEAIKLTGKIIEWMRTAEVITTGATEGLTVATEGFSAALLTIAWPVAIIAGIVVASYEIYEHWADIKSLWASIKAPDAAGGTSSLAIVETHNALSFLGTAVEGITKSIRYVILDFIPEMYHFGGRIITELGRGILHAVEFNLSDVLKAVGKKIMGFFPHSPVKEGPLQDLENITIVETIAEAILRSSSLLGNALSKTLGGSMHQAWQSIKSFAGVGADRILHGLMGTESSYGKMLTNPASSAIGPFQMTRGFRQTWGVTPEQAMSMGTSTDVANRVIFGKYMPEFGGDINKALSAWHQGEGWVRSHGVDSDYVNSVMRHTPASAAGSAGVTINLHYAPTIHGATPEDLNKHADHIVRIVKNKLGREARLRYD